MLCNVRSPLAAPGPFGCCTSPCQHGRRHDQEHQAPGKDNLEHRQTGVTSNLHTSSSSSGSGAAQALTNACKAANDNKPYPKTNTARVQRCSADPLALATKLITVTHALERSCMYSPSTAGRGIATRASAPRSPMMGGTWADVSCNM